MSSQPYTCLLNIYPLSLSTQAFSVCSFTHRREVIWKGCEWLHACLCTHQCSRASEAGDCSYKQQISVLVHKGIVACFLSVGGMLFHANTGYSLEYSLVWSSQQGNMRSAGICTSELPRAVLVGCLRNVRVVLITWLNHVSSINTYLLSWSIFKVKASHLM